MERVVVIGAIAAGTKAASRLKRLCPSIDITMIDENEYISIGACGIPYYISGEAGPLDTLRSSSGVLRDPDYFKKKGINTLNKTRALAINRKEHTVLVKNLRTNEESILPYDKLILATGSKPWIPPIQGTNLKGVTTATLLEEAQYINDLCASGHVKHAIIVGGSFIGIEVAIALVERWGIHTSIIEFMPQLMPNALSPDLSTKVSDNLSKHNVHIFTSEKLLHISGELSVEQVTTDKQTLPAELVIFATGFKPNTALAKEAGLIIDTKTGGICINEHMQTSDPCIYAGGDCVAIVNLITKKLGTFAFGSLANRQGRVIGNTIAGKQSVFNGAVGNWCIKLFNYSAAGAGLTLAQAKNEGFNAFSANIKQMDRAKYFAESTEIALELIFDAQTRRILGVQGISPNGDALKARIDVIATMLQFGTPVIDDLANTEVSYAPPFNSAMDIINTAANIADTIIEKQYEKQ